MPHELPPEATFDVAPSAQQPGPERHDGVTRPRLFFMLTAETPCPYLAGRWERKLVAEMSGPDAADLHTRLSRAGFRRSHHFAYRPACQGCEACVPVRIDVAEFGPSRSQRRIWRSNSDLSARVCPPTPTAEQYDLFRRYLYSRHGDGEMAAMGWSDYRAMIEETALESAVAEFRDSQGQLVAACLMDWLHDGGSAVYSFFSPDMARRSLGNYCILWLIEETRRRHLPYLYLGYWVERSPKMAYKGRFRSLQALTSGGWQGVSRR